MGDATGEQLEAVGLVGAERLSLERGARSLRGLVRGEIDEREQVSGSAILVVRCSTQQHLACRGVIDELQRCLELCAADDCLRQNSRNAARRSAATNTSKRAPASCAAGCASSVAAAELTWVIDRSGASVMYGVGASSNSS